MGLTPGPAFQDLLQRLRLARLDGEVHTTDDERQLVRRWVQERA